MTHKKTIFCDLDGTLFFYRDWLKFSTRDDDKIIKSTFHFLLNEYDEGSKIVITTARPSELEDYTKKQLKKHRVPSHHLIMDLPTGQRILINDLNPDNEEKPKR